MPVRVCVCVCTCVYVREHVHVRVYMCMCACTCAYVHICQGLLRFLLIHVLGMTSDVCNAHIIYVYNYVVRDIHAVIKFINTDIFMYCVFIHAR